MKIAPTLTAAATLVVGGLVVSPASADLFVGDSFLTGTDPSAGQYAPGPIRGQNPAIPGYDPGSVWGGSNTAASGAALATVVSGNFSATAGTLSSPATGFTGEAGGKVNVQGVAGNNDTVRFAVRNVLPQTSNTFFFSTLINRGSGDGATAGVAAPVNPGSYAVTGFINAGSEAQKLQGPDAGAGNLFGLTYGLGGNATGGYDVVLRHRRRDVAGGPVPVSNDTLLAGAAANTTYTLVLRADVNALAGADVVTGNDLITYWVGTGPGFDLTSEATAAATAAATGTIQSFGFNTTSDLTRAIFAQKGYEATTAFFDENRYGDTFASVTAVAPIPEPASLAVVALGGLALLRRRRA